MSFGLILGFFPSFVEVKEDEVRFPFVGGGTGGLCRPGVWWSCASGPRVQHLPSWRHQDPPRVPNGCKVVYFGFPLSKYRTLFFALVPVMPTNYLLPLLAQSNQMQLIYTVSLGVFSHNMHALLWLQEAWLFPWNYMCLGESKGRPMGGSQTFHYKGPLSHLFFGGWTQSFVRFCLPNCNWQVIFSHNSIF